VTLHRETSGWVYTQTLCTTK